MPTGIRTPESRARVYCKHAYNSEQGLSRDDLESLCNRFRKNTELRADDLSTALKGAYLIKYEDALRELGFTSLEDLAQLEETDMVKVGMNKIEIKRLQRMCMDAWLES